MEYEVLSEFSQLGSNGRKPRWIQDMTQNMDENTQSFDHIGVGFQPTDFTTSAYETLYLPTSTDFSLQDDWFRGEWNQINPTMEFQPSVIHDNIGLVTEVSPVTTEMTMFESPVGPFFTSGQPTDNHVGNITEEDWVGLEDAETSPIEVKKENIEHVDQFRDYREDDKFLSQRQKKRKRDSVNLDQMVTQTTVTDPRGFELGSFSTLGTAKKAPKRKYDDTKKKEVAEMRKLRACTKCKSRKIQCGRVGRQYQLCVGCAKIKIPLSLKLPCFLESLIDAKLFRSRAAVGHPLYFLRKGVYRLQDVDTTQDGIHTVLLSQGVGDVLSVNIAQYPPQTGDKTGLVWKDRSGMLQVTPLTPYCIIGVEDAKDRMLEYIERSRDGYINHLQGVDELTFSVFDKAQGFAAFNPRSTVRMALNLFAANRIIERDWYLCGEDTSGLPLIEEPQNPWFRTRPVTPMMDCQLDQLVIQGFLQPLREELLKQLHEDINTRRKEKWFEIFLTIFILLANAEQLLAHSRRNAIRHGAQGRYNSPELALDYFHACKMLIAGFHFICGYKMSLALDWRSSDASDIANLDGDQVGFMGQLQGKIRSNREDLLSLRGGFKFEHPSYWTHQMMFEGWNAGDCDAEDDHIRNAP